MKSALFVSALLTLFVAIFYSSSFTHSGYIKPEVLAQANTDSKSESLEKDASVATEAAEKVEEKVQYELAYPGMLPDSPLYFLKVLRDRIVKFLISDPLKEAEFNLLTSDKRVYAALLLVEKNKHDLALTTLSKSNNYFHEAVSSLSEAKGKGVDIKPLYERMSASVKKHEEILRDQIMPKSPKNLMKDFERELERLELIEKSVNSIKPK